MNNIYKLNTVYYNDLLINLLTILIKFLSILQFKIQNKPNMYLKYFFELYDKCLITN